jgi:hypothetical protein
MRSNPAKRQGGRFSLKRLPGVGSEPMASQFNSFSHFHHFTAEPQRLPMGGRFLYL